MFKSKLNTIFNSIVPAHSAADERDRESLVNFLAKKWVFRLWKSCSRKHKHEPTHIRTNRKSTHLIFEQIVLRKHLCCLPMMMAARTSKHVKQCGIWWRAFSKSGDEEDVHVVRLKIIVVRVLKKLDYMEFLYCPVRVKRNILVVDVGIFCDIFLSRENHTSARERDSNAEHR